VGERIYSRLSEMCHIREVKGEDYRKTAQAKLSRKRRQP
jgi:DNA replication protein DnaC